jgi:DnaJ-class molecular chaperone
VNGKTKERKIKLKMAFEELYSGAEKTVTYERKRQSPHCKGFGTADAESAGKCPECEGRGFIALLLGALTPAKGQCQNCGGTGRPPITNPCGECAGKGVYVEEVSWEVKVEPGMDDGEEIRFSGASDEAQGVDCGDVVVQIDQLDHEVFKRNGLHVLYEKEIGLSDALFGARFPLDTLDGRKLIVETDRHRTTNHGDVLKIADEGFRRRGDTGSLFIAFQVRMPERKHLTKAFRTELCRVQPHRDYAKGLRPGVDGVSLAALEVAELSEFLGETSSGGEERDGEEADGEEEESGDSSSSQWNAL